MALDRTTWTVAARIDLINGTKRRGCVSEQPKPPRPPAATCKCGGCADARGRCHAESRQYRRTLKERSMQTRE